MILAPGAWGLRLCWFEWWWVWSVALLVVVVSRRGGLALVLVLLEGGSRKPLNVIARAALPRPGGPWLPKTGSFDLRS